MVETKPDNEELLARAREGIEAHRKTDLTVAVTGEDGRPLAGARLALRMVRHHFLFGCALFEALADREEPSARRKPIEGLDHWDDFRRRADELFNFCTLPVYWGHYEAVRGRTRAAQVKRLHEWCTAQGMKTKGHPLVWCQAVPDWLPSARGELRQAMEKRMAELVADFGPASDHPLDFVDFLNEPTIQPQNFDNPLALWMRELGGGGTAEQTYDLCRGFDLPARGILNHFMRDEEFLAVGRRAIDSGRPLRAIGLQSHQHSGTRPLWMFQKETDCFTAGLGLPVHWTENSVLSGESRRIRFVQGKADVPPWPSTPEGEEHQARALAEQYTLLFGHEKVEALTQWNFTDATSWLGAPSGLLDKDLQPKPAYTALHDLVRRQWWTDVDLVTGADGRVAARVFRGDYTLRIESPTGELLAQLGTAAERKVSRLEVHLEGLGPQR